jgi:electron transport complex protein RnfG
MFDQFTGATITPRAVVRAVRNTVIYFNEHQDKLFDSASNCQNKDSVKETL